MKDYQKLLDYFSPFLIQIDPDNKNKITEVFKQVNEEYWTHPAASGDHHNELQAKVHGLMYHVFEGLININQFIRSRSDIMKRYTDMGSDYEGTKGKSKDGKILGMPEIDLNVGYLLHDILKFKSNPSGSNYTHDEDAYHWLKTFGFNPVILMIVRFTHGQWSTGLKYKRDFRGTKYEDLVWLSHYADMSSSSQTNLKFIDVGETLLKFEIDGKFEGTKIIKNPYDFLPDFDKEILKKNKEIKKKDKNASIDITWWNKKSSDVKVESPEGILSEIKESPKVEINEVNPDGTPKLGTIKDPMTTGSVSSELEESW